LYSVPGQRCVAGAHCNESKLNQTRTITDKMVVPLVQPTAVCLAAAAVVLQQCNEDTTTNSPLAEVDGPQSLMIDDRVTHAVDEGLEFPTVAESSSKRLLSKRSSVSFRDEVPHGNTQLQHWSSWSASHQGHCDPEKRLEGQPLSSSIQSSSLSIEKASGSRSIKSIFSRDRSISKGTSVYLHKSKNEELADAPNGFVAGDFISGKVCDLGISGGCFVMEFLPDDASLLAIGLLNGHGVEIYETTTYSLVARLEQDDAISSLSWLKINDVRNRSLALLAVGSLDGQVSVYRMQPDLLELQGADLILRTQVNAQVRATNLVYFRHPEEKILLAIGDTSGDLTFSRFTMDCALIDTRIVHSNESGILDIAMTKSGDLIAFCSKMGDVSVCRIQTTTRLYLSTPLGFVLYSSRRNGAVHAIAFSSDEKRLVFGGYDKTVVVVDTELWAEIRCLKLDGTVNHLSFDPIDRYLAVGCRDKSFVLYDTSTFFAVKTVRTPSWVTHVSWGSTRGDTDIVAIRSEKVCVSILDLSPIRKTQCKLAAADTTFTSLSFSYDGRFLARTSGTKVIVSDSFREFSYECEIDLKGHLKCVSFCCADGRRDHLAAVGLHGYVHLLRLREQHSKVAIESVETKFIEDSLWVVAWSISGEFIVTGGRGKKLHVLATTNLKPKCDPLEIDGRVWSVAFMPEGIEVQLQAKSAAYGMAVGSGEYSATLFETESFQPTLKIVRPRAVRCVAYHPWRPLLAIGDGGNVVSIVNFNDEEIVQNIQVAARVNVVAFSPQGDHIVVGTDGCQFTLHETKSWRIIQEIPTDSAATSASFSGSGKFLALGCARGGYFLLQLGPFLSIEFVPMATFAGANQLPAGVLQEILHRSGSGPSLVQRYMLEGSPDSLRRAAALISSYPDTIYCFDRCTGDSSFDTALKLNKPNLLKLVLTCLVNGTLESDGDGRRTILTSNLPERGRDALRDMIRNSPPEFVVSILSDMTFLKVPFTNVHEVSGRQKVERGSVSYTDPWKVLPSRRLERTKKSKNLYVEYDRARLLRTPAVLPLPGLGSLSFLSSLLQKTSPTAFDNVAMGLVLRVMWDDYIWIFFQIDLIVFLFYCALWVCLVDWTSSTTSVEGDSLTGLEKAMSFVMLVLNTVFAAKELRQSRCGRRLAYWGSLWNAVDSVSIVFVYVYGISTITGGGVGTGNVPLAVFTTLLLTMKLLSYLRGFDSTGWLISVLVQNFTDVQGFMVVLLTILFGFTTSFRLLFGNVVGRCSVKLDDNDELDQTCEPDPFDSIGRSFLSTFALTIIGTFDEGVLNSSDYSFLSILTFVVAVLCVLVVALNALIAVLSDSYARVQENAVANRRKERAELVVEYLSILPTAHRRRIEQETMYFHALLEADDDGDLLINKDDWEGGLNALKKDLEELNEEAKDMNRHALEELRSELNNDIGSFRREVVGILENLAQEVRQIKEIQSQGGVTFNGKHVARAVRMVKQIGKKGLFQPSDQMS
jgi:WD40 repeat protein